MQGAIQVLGFSFTFTFTYIIHIFGMYVKEREISVSDQEY